jgi:peptidoglycan/LPS O-acetylase OafA/YrhL
MKFIGQVLEENKGVGPGFDFLRVFLALSVVAVHALTVTNQYWFPDDQPVWFLHDSIVPMFFAVSGFLVCASAYRLSAHNFLISRLVRVVPGLAVDTLVCALLIGPIFTTVSLRQYFSDPRLPAYFLNIFGWVHYYLPGVFTHFPNPRINGSLWSIPFELACYFILFGFIVVKLLRFRFLVLALVVAYVLASILTQALAPSHIHNATLLKIVQSVFYDYQSEAVTGFLVGIVAYQFRQHIPYSRILFVVCLIAGIAMALLFPRHAALMRLIWIPSIVYITVFVGLTPMPLPRFFKTGDYSYGIYLYHQPFLQVILALFPALAFAPPFGAPFAFLASLPFVIGVAWLSWHFVEKPALALRKRFSQSKEARAIRAPPSVQLEPISPG